MGDWDKPLTAKQLVIVLIAVIWVPSIVLAIVWASIVHSEVQRVEAASAVPVLTQNNIDAVADKMEAAAASPTNAETEAALNNAAGY